MADQPIKYHAFVCATQRPPGHPRGCCTSKGGGAPVFERLMTHMQTKMLWDKGVSVAQSSCIGMCNAGPVMVVYPEGVWYHLDKPEDVDEIVEQHFLGGTPVERLKVFK